MLTPEQQEQAVRKLAKNITDAVVGNEYGIVLEALLHTFMTAAEAEPNWTQAAANAAMRASMRLAQHAAGLPQHSVH